MFIRNLTFRPTVAHNLFLAVLLISIISIASAASDGAVFSFSDPFREFLGIQSPPVASIAANRIATKRPAGGSWLLSEQNSAAFLAPCDTPFANEIVEENCKTGNPALEWDISGAGDSSIQGFATDISVNRGGTISFKVDTDASSIQIKIYRLGYYNGDGARLIATIPDTSTTVSAQPACTNSGAPDYLIDCGGWSVSGSWTATDDTYAPSKPAVSGLYVARLERTDSTNGSSHIPFIVRDDTGGSDLLFKTSDTTWQAYNQYGGYSLYAGPAIPNGGHAHKVSYNRPFTTRDTPVEDNPFNAEYPMIRWLERNGYNISYLSSVDADRIGTELLEHKVVMSVGHDEYWSAGERTAFEAARDAGRNLAFFSGNEVYWKTRWEDNHRTLVSYKEGDAQGSNEHWDCFGNFNCDPDSTVWTGLWRQNQTGHDGGQPENSLTGQISWADETTAIEVPATATGLRFWRNTGMSAATTLTADTLGYEFDWEQPAFASSNPPGRITLSDTTAAGKTHKMSLYRADSGALVFGAGTVQWSWGLDGTHDRGGSTEDPRMQQATVNLFSDMGVQPSTLQSGLTAGGALDTVAPTATITSPTGGSTVPGGNITILGTAADTGGIVAAVEISIDGGTTWSRATGTTSWSYTISSSNASMTVQARAIDDAANIGTPMTRNFTAAAQTCPCSIFAPAVTGVQENDAAAVELGVKFRSDISGFITGIRFYKTAGNTGTHTGRLWSAGGANLGAVTFTSETGSGWQEAIFSSPIAIDAATTYVASYHTTSGNYAIGTSFAAAGVDNPPLHSLQGGVDGPNGVYIYGSGGVFPTETFGSSNYLVDVVFNGSVGPDLTPPSITAFSPTSGATGVAVNSAVNLTFNEPIDQLTVSGSTFELRDNLDVLVAADVTYNSGSRTAILSPTTALAYSTTYTATITGGSSDPRIKDVAGNALSTSQTWSFSTASAPPPPPTEGPGGPILVVSAASNPFSRYFVEILRAEGLNEFFAMDISQVTPSILNGYDAVILGEMPIDSAQATMFSDWTTAGGTFIAMRPDPDLHTLLGITPAGGTLAEKYLLVNQTGPGIGIVNQTIQFHGTADLYTLSGADTIATLYSNATTATANPAITTRTVGSVGGKAIAFTYDLAKSIVYTRQGNPAWAGQSRDGQPGPKRSDNLFFGNATGDPQPDWVDFNKIQIPQADEQQRLLANAITLGIQHRKPLPRFWYFPRGEKAVVVMTGDDHASNGTPGQFDWDIAQSPSGCNVADWECIRGTSYIFNNTGIGVANAVSYEAQGFEIALHVSTNCEDFTSQAHLAGFFTSQLATFATNFPDVAAPSTSRTHCIAWSDWVSEAKVAYSNGIRLDTNYYYWPASWVLDRPGHFTGSGMPMRFADLDGSMIDVYQAATQMTDESGINYTTHINTLLGNATGPLGYYGVVTANMHTDTGPHPGQIVIVNAAKAMGVPVVSARQLLTWLDGRNGSSFGSVSWSGNSLNFSVAVGSGANGLQVMLPIQSAVGPLGTITFGGNPVTYTAQTIKGINYAVFNAQPGAYVADYSPDTTPPTVQSVTPGDAATNVAASANVTAVFSESLDPLTVGAATFELTDPSNALVTATVTYDDLTRTATLNPSLNLAYSTTYTAKLIGGSTGIKDSAGNPLALDYVWSFTTAAAPPCFVDDTTVDFALGTTGSSTSVTTTGNGEVTLKSTVENFDTFPSTTNWQSFPWSSGGTSTVSGGKLNIDGARFNTEPTTTTYGPGTTIEFAATFAAASFQHIGFGKGTDEVEPGPGIYNTSPMAAFSTGGGTSVITRVWPEGGGGFIDYPIPSSLTGTQHLYRIEWTATTIDFYVDGLLVNSQASVITSPMRPAANDYTVGGLSLQLDWIGISPSTYATTGSFTSRVFDGGAETTWGAMDWTSTLPTGTSLVMYYRTGSTPTPDGSWTDFYTVATSGTSLGTTSRYIQYRADLATTAPGSTPVLSYVSIGCDGIATASGPIISNILAMPGVDGTSATITWTTDIASTSTVDYGVSTGGLIPVTNANLVTSHSVNLTGLNPSTIYYYRVTSVDGTSISSSSPQSPSTLNFTTSALPGSCPCSIWDDTSGVGVNGNDASPYELGVKFRSSLAGFITGVRFYKYSSNTGTHTGHLWDINGNLLGSATFTNEAVSGWQEVSFASPVAISANTVYVASYSTTTGNYAFSGGYFTSQGVDNGPLHALSASESPNGVLNTSPGQFPNLTFNDANYWVDAVFDTMDIVPPAISNVAAMPGSNGTTATITWTTDELADSRVDYGTSPASLNLNSIDAGQTTTHSIDLNGLTPGQTYYFRVTSKDGSNNSATSPESPAEPLQFSTNGLTITDTTVADFGAASSDTCYVSNTSGGEVILPPTLAAEFSGAVLPAGWADYAWTGGISTVAGGKVSVNGSRLNQSDTTGFTAGRSLEFVATFKSVTYQNIGFAAGDNDTAEPSSGALADGTQPWAMFGKSTATDHIFSRINSTGTSVDVDLGPVTEAPHLYKIEWLADNTVNFFIDGVLKDSRLASFGAVLMRSVISDYANDGTTLDVDWMRMSPYVSPCTFTSRVFDAGTPVVWDQMTWNGSTPAGTSLAMSYRIGNSPTPDGMWSGFVPASVSPATLAGNARYIQYQAILATSDANQTPTLTDVNITYSSGTDSSPPIITDRSPLPNAVNVNVGTNIGVTFSEPMNSSTITAGNFRMHRNGDAGDTPATLIVTGNSATLDPTTDLQPFSTYTVYADSGITDVTGNPLTPESWVYTTAAPILSATDTTTADFTAGTTNCVVDPLINDGALRQATTLEEEFSGATLPGGWSSTPWTGGTSSVSGGVLSVDGSLAFTNDLYGPGRSIEFVATFGTSSFQHAGLGVDMNTTPLWAVFSTKDTSNSLYARTNNNGSTADTLIPGSWLGTPHRFRIDWYANSIVFSIDGTIVHVEVVSIANNMRPVVSDYNFGEPALTVDWLRMSPYATPCTFTSRVIDAGSVVDWLDLTSTGTTPTGTSVGFETRSGNATDTNDSSWSSWEAVNSPIASPNSRYIQYRSTLANTDDTQTPVVESVNITYQNQPTFTLTYDANGGSGSPPVDGTAYAYNASVTVASQGSLVRTGYSFAGWNTAANGSGTQFAAGGSFNIVASTSVYAKWTAASQTLTFNSNGGSAVTAITQDFGTAVSAPADPTRTGYTFAGWYTDDGTFLNAYTFSTMGVSTTIHAKWTAVSQTLTFNSNGGSAATAITQDFGTAISAPADPTKAGYTFAGWYNEAGLTTPHVFDFMGLSTTVYAKWTIVEYTISGKVLTPGNAGLVNVMMTLTGDSGGSATTDANGNYSIDGITPGGNYVVTPSLSGYTFVPATRSYTSLSADVSNADFTGYGGGFESDVALPNDGQVSVTDYTRTGSLAVGLATPDPLTNEFQRADSAPRATRGDGLITAADYVQAGRYAAGIDNVQPAGGTPFASLFSVQEMIKEQEDNQRALLPRVVSVIDTSGYAGQQVVVSIKVEASGDESGFGFTVSYDGTKLSDPFVMTGADMPFSAPIINTQTAGKVGVITASPFGATMPFGSREIVKIRFNILPTASGGPTSITFTGAPPVVNQVSSAAAEALPTTFTAGTVTILSPTAIGTSVGGIVLSPGGQAVRNARLSMTDQSGMVRTVVSNSFGFFRFDDVTVGETYVIDVRAKGLHFAPQVVSVADEITDLIIVAEP